MIKWICFVIFIFGALATDERKLKIVDSVEINKNWARKLNDAVTTGDGKNVQSVFNLFRQKENKTLIEILMNRNDKKKKIYSPPFCFTQRTR